MTNHDVDPLIERFCEAMAVFAKSVGICGLVEGRAFAHLVLADGPLSQDELMQRVGCSRGNISQALRRLTEVGFVCATTQRGSRRVTYETHADLWRITTSVLLGRIRHHLDVLEREFATLIEAARELKGQGADATSRHQAAKLLRQIERFDRFAFTTATLLQTVQRLVERGSH